MTVHLRSRPSLFRGAAAPTFLAFLLATHVHSAARPWLRHTIDDSSAGADGVRTVDANGDGRLDLVTGWEEGGLVRIYLHPGSAAVRVRWPAVTVGPAKSVEDAVWADLDGDGQFDVVSSCEGSAKAMFVHWAPAATNRLEPTAWRTELLLQSRGRMQWMFSLPMQVDGQHGIDLVAAGKGEGAGIGWFRAPGNPRALDAWRWQSWHPVGWIMSIVPEDMNGDGRIDIVYTDRKGRESGAYWLENPGNTSSSPWTRHLIGGRQREVMFLDIADLDGDGLRDLLVASKPQDILFLRRKSRDGHAWDTHTIKIPSQAGRAKAVAAGDLDGDRRTDLVFSCEGATEGRHGLMWLSSPASPLDPGWNAHTLSGPDGVKHDLVRLLDLDGDGDLDVITCEETKKLGLIWYENPISQPQ